MDNKEAIEILRNHTQYFIPTEDINALNTAIKSLEAWDRVKDEIIEEINECIQFNESIDTQNIF